MNLKSTRLQRFLILYYKLLGISSLVPIFASAAVSPNATLTAEQAAARFLSQATFGPSAADIAAFRPYHSNYEAWIDLQAAKPVTLSADVLEAARRAGKFTFADQMIARNARLKVMLTADDQLRQRMAYALSQIIVISDNDSAVQDADGGSCSFWDMLARNALGNFRTLMLEVTQHPMMGRYLTYYRNRKAPVSNLTQPDENYARELMQLFTIGLYHLNEDGSVVTDVSGRPLETYTNTQITHFARVFTGFTDAGTQPTGSGPQRLDFPFEQQNFIDPMRMWEPQHDTGAKILLSYPGARKVNLPAGQTGLQDVRDALDNLIEHPSCAPFISRILIQRLVSSNPSPDYIRRVAKVFANNGAGVRGDLLAVVKAILLDPEARGFDSIGNPRHGKLREPFLRVTHTLRAFRFRLAPWVSDPRYEPRGGIPYNIGFDEGVMGQYPLGSPSVFNFYSPDYEPAGPIKSAGLVGPEYQILNSVTAVSFPNALNNLVALPQGWTPIGTFELDLAEQTKLADNPDALIDNLDLLLTHGTMSNETRAAIRVALTSITQGMVTPESLSLKRAQLAIRLVLSCPEYAVQK